jgi:tripartite-type tricarboxylate transporter receptor subunit TctC
MARTIRYLLLSALALFVPLTAQAQTDYPNRQIRLVVGYGPGASTDLMARFTAEHMGNILGQRILVENRPGADSAIATRAVAREKADGYTLLFGTLTVATNTLTKSRAIRSTISSPSAPMATPATRCS